MRILIFAWVVVFIACVLHITHAGETKRKKLVLVVPEKVKHIHHHHVKKIYIKSKPHYYTSYEEGLHREDSAGSFHDDDDVGAIKIKSHHHKRHSGGRHEHTEENKKVVVHSGVPDSSDWHEDKSTEVRHSQSDHASAASIISKLQSQPTKSSSESSSEEEQRTIVFLGNDGSMTESTRGHIKTVHHHHHHHDHHDHHGKEKFSAPPNNNTEPEAARPQNLEPRPHTLESRPQNIINHAPKRPPNRPPFLHQPRPQNHNHENNRPPNRINHEPNRPHIHMHGGKPPIQTGEPFHGTKGEKNLGRNSTFIENLVPPPVNQPSFTRVVHGSAGYSLGQPGSHPPNRDSGRPAPSPKIISGPVPQNTPNRISPSGNHGARTTFFHKNNQPLHSWRKR